jgi:hypothetical protein
MNQPSDRDHELHRALQEVVPPASSPVIEEEILIRIDTADRDRRSDDLVVARFFGVCVLVIGVIPVFPAAYYWLLLAGENTGPVPKWIWTILFVAALHGLYGIYVLQLTDYSALQMLSVFLLAMTCMYGFAGMSLILGEGSGQVARFLQIPTVLQQQAVIWCGIMFGLTALVCYLSGREAMAWQRRHQMRVRSVTGIGS